MSDSWNRHVDYPGPDTTLSETSARQGRTGMGVRYVLAVSLGIVVVAFVIAYLFFFG